MSNEAIDSVIDEIIDGLNKLTLELRSLQTDIVEQLDKLAFGIDDSKKEITSLLAGMVDLLTAITDKEYRVNDLIEAITEVILAHKEKRKAAGEIVNEQ